MNSLSPSRHDIVSEAELLDAVGGSRLQLRFQGPFEGKMVTWDATFIALMANQEIHPHQRNFIDIGETGTEGIRLTVGLMVSDIDLPTIRKAMMMIRQYKRLQKGRHVYGSPGPTQSGG